MFIPRRNADKSVWSPWQGYRLWKSRETCARARPLSLSRTSVRRNEGPFKCSRPYSGTRGSHCLLVALLVLLTMVVVTSELALRLYARSRATFSSPIRFRRRFFTVRHCSEHTFHGHPTRPRTMSDVRALRACGRCDNSFSA